MKNLEIGITYYRDGKYYVAVQEDTLAGYENGKLFTQEPVYDYTACRGLEVKDLCKKWNVGDVELNNLSKLFFTPLTCKDQNPSERTARKNEGRRTPPIRIVKMIP